MAQKRKRQKGVSWELIGIVAVLVVFVVGILYWVTSPAARGAPEPPDFSSTHPDQSGPASKPEAGVTSPESSTGAIPTGTTEDGRPFLGKADAPVTIYEFADFQCPHCKAYATEDSKPIKTDYLAKGVARLVFVNFPFLGDESNQAAKAGFCANEQGKFWDMHDWMFHNQATAGNTGGFARERLVQIAQAVGIDTTAFEKCLDDPAIADRVTADRDFATQTGVKSTPSFLIGETLVEGSVMLDLRKAIDKAAAAKQ